MRSVGCNDVSDSVGCSTITTVPRPDRRTILFWDRTRWTTQPLPPHYGLTAAPILFRERTGPCGRQEANCGLFHLYPREGRMSWLKSRGQAFRRFALLQSREMKPGTGETSGT